MKTFINNDKSQPDFGLNPSVSKGKKRHQEQKKDSKGMEPMTIHTQYTTAYALPGVENKKHSTQFSVSSMKTSHAAQLTAMDKGNG
jgi:hypothetical protein